MNEADAVPYPVQIVADDRERESGVIEALKELDGVNVRVERLGLGDYKVDEWLLVERKTLPDLTLSIQSGRLFEQAQRLSSSPLRSIVILEGTSQDLAESGMRREAVQGALITLTLIFGLPILRASLKTCLRDRRCRR